MEMISIATHCNVIRARGFCITLKEKLLVYPYMANGSVAFWLRERKESLPPLNWLTRIQIALGAAKGLAYLHHECPRKIIHCDVKASNILLDENFEAVLADLSVGEFVDCCGDDIVTPVKGTLGHIAPEYLATGKCSVKNDVFGYGVFLLELITAQSSYDLGRLAYDNDMLLLDWVSHIYIDKECEVIVDAELQREFLDEEVEELMQIALICTQDDPEGRPTMFEVVRRLKVAYRLANGEEEWSSMEDFKEDILEGRDDGNFSLDKLHAATEGFSNKIISEDSFSVIYEGWLDGYPVAVKRYNSQSLEYYFERELEIGQICSQTIPNLSHVIGFCRMPEVKLLVFPLMVNGSVDSWLKGRHESRPPLTWKQRKNIAIGAAKGLAYLHHECPRKIIHRDVKASNILLDENFEAVLADLSLGELVDCCGYDIVTPVKGTIGHIAPEYLATGKCSVKNDIFGYGVFLLELITAQRTFDLARFASDNDMMLLDWVKDIYKEREWKVIVDTELQGDFIDKEVEELLQIALICTQGDPEERLTMLKVARRLEVAYHLAKGEAEWSMEDFKEDILGGRDVENFSLDKLHAATEGFSNKIISEDSFNVIYKGWLDGYPVAVKRYNSQSLEYYFERELDIGQICSQTIRNLVHVIGFCRMPEVKLLVFPLMVNGSVDSWLTGRHESRPPLTWKQRKNIAFSAARGLAHLHDKCKKKIIHCDVKAANILLDDNFEAVVTDFKSAKIMDHNQTHITTTVTGTIGHIAPEYIASGECSDKTDVFSYGVFLLELITGRRIIDLIHVADEKDMMCVDWVKKNYEERRWKSMADNEGGYDFMNAVRKQLVKIAALCTGYYPARRPRMSDVVMML